jgi:hypothetical protein
VLQELASIISRYPSHPLLPPPPSLYCVTQLDREKQAKCHLAHMIRSLHSHTPLSCPPLSPPPSACWFFLQLDREKQAEAVLQELASIISRYRGPLLESSVDLEQRLWHLATMTGEVREGWGEESDPWLRYRQQC